MGPLLAYLLLQVVLLFDALGWEVKMPKEIHGLRGSCLVIPCSFSYSSDPPENPRRVVWYQWASWGYPLVYDPSNAGDVIEKFRGKTYLYGSSYWGCSLLIKNLQQSHHEEKIYTWIDPENVGWRTYAFYDVTSTILVDASPNKPVLSSLPEEIEPETQVTIKCSVNHTCSSHPPEITWSIPTSRETVRHSPMGGGVWETESTVTFSPTGYEDKDYIVCSVKFWGGKTQETKAFLSVKTHFQYEADVIPLITALTDSCVVIPCSFKIEKKDVSNLHVLWVTQKNDFMFHTNTGNILDSFKDRTKLLGNPEEQNCTVEINDVQTRDTGQFCFKAEKDKEKYSFNNSCVLIVTRASPNKPVMSSLPEDREPETPVTIKCAVNHTCSSHPPEITWSVPTSRETVRHSPMGGGVWETESTVTFSPTGYEDKDNIVCSVKFWGREAQETEAFLSVKRVQEVGFWPYIIVSSLFIIICILAGVFIYKRRNRINNTSTVSGSQHFSKPYMPSPKSQPKSHSDDDDYEADYINMADFNVYGNV